MKRTQKQEQISPRAYTMDEIEDMAIEGRELPQGMNYADTLLFLMYRSLYEHAAIVQMDQDQGKREKARILAAHKRYMLDQEIEHHTSQLWLGIEQAASRYNKAQTVGEAIQAADSMMLALYRMPVNRIFEITSEIAQQEFQTFGKTKDE